MILFIFFLKDHTKPYIFLYNPLGGTYGFTNGGYVLMSNLAGVLILMNSNNIILLTVPSTDLTKFSVWSSGTNDKKCLILLSLGLLTTAWIVKRLGSSFWVPAALSALVAHGNSNDDITKRVPVAPHFKEHVSGILHSIKMSSSL